MKDVEKSWKEQMNDPGSFEDMIPYEARQRIEQKLFPGNSKKKTMPLWLSHTAATIAGILISAAMFYFWKHTPPAATIGQTIVQSNHRDTVYIETTTAASADQAATAPAIHTRRAGKKQSTAVTKDPVPATQPIADYSKEPPGNRLPEEKNGEPENDPYIARESKPRRRVVAVSDIAPSYNITTFTERVTRPVMARSHNPGEQSPFKFIKNYQ